MLQKWEQNSEESHRRLGGLLQKNEKYFDTASLSEDTGGLSQTILEFLMNSVPICLRHCGQGGEAYYWVNVDKGD